MEMGKISFHKLILIDDFKTYILLFQMYSWKMLLVALAFIGCASAFNVAKVEPKVGFYDEDHCWIFTMMIALHIIKSLHDVVGCHHVG